MTKRPWTPGPWKRGCKTKNSVRLDAPEWLEFAKVFVRVDGKPEPEGEANANLIAAAPDLYEALDDLVNYLADTAHHNALPVAFARAALRTARGKS